MKVERDQPGPGPIVTGFGPGGFRVGEARYRALLLTVEAAHDWTPPLLAALAPADLQPLTDYRPEFILLGTGPTLRRPSPGLVGALDALGIGLEMMDSRAAARAWGVLRGEGRVVAAALYPLD
ncbi:Mth938-like domain-containing protein [uncultured Sphingomonas sp.]|uniref:Mth938-like domain-containing protein n=1 Tax=uncultured Sphingomonas sp. TaxID=158754 RepID=UPI0035CB273E